MQLVDKVEWEASLPKKSLEEEAEARRQKEEQEKSAAAAASAPKTPGAVNRFHSKKKKAGHKNHKPTNNGANKPHNSKDDAPGQERDGADKKPLKLPEASYWVIDDYDISDAPPRPSAYYR